MSENGRSMGKTETHDGRNPPSELVPLSLMAAALGVAPSDLRIEALAGRIPCVQIGKRSLLFDRDRIRLWLLDRAQAEDNNDGR